MATKRKWGIEFPAKGVSEFDMWAWRYAHDKRPESEGGPSFEDKWEAFQHCVDLLWNNKDSTRRVIWNDWTNRMLQAMIKYRYCSLAGSGSSGKSDAAAVFAMVEWLTAPTETLCLVTSTTKDGARKRIWKSVTELWNSIESQFEREGKIPPGKMIASRALLKGMDINGIYSEALGLTVVAADTASEQEAAKKLKGLKAPAEGRGRLRLCADEMTDLGWSVLTAGIGNLNTNPDFKMVALANPRNRIGCPFADISKPVNGWNSVSIADTEWETDVGVCLRFDATKSPRILEKDGADKYGWMPSQQAIDQMALKFGEDSAEYWSQVLGMWPPDGLSNTIWAEGELIRAQEAEFKFEGPTRYISALDIPYNSGGDRAVCIWAECGVSEGKKRMMIKGYKVLTEGLNEETLQQLKKEEGEDMSANLHVMKQYVQLNQSLGIAPRYTGFDSTAGGMVFAQWLEREWQPGCNEVNFGGKPAERRFSFASDETQYGNRVAQLWCQPKSLVRENQIGGMPIELCKELCQRKYSDKHHSGKTYIESKKDLKKRTGESPDLADAFVILIEVALLNNLLNNEETATVERQVLNQWKQTLNRGYSANVSTKKLVR